MSGARAIQAPPDQSVRGKASARARAPPATQTPWTTSRSGPSGQAPMVRRSARNLGSRAATIFCRAVATS